MNLVGDNMDARKVGLEVNIEKIRYMLSHHQNAVKNWDRKTANTAFENVSQFKYLGMTVTNQHLIQEEIKTRSNSGKACYHSVQNLLSFRLLSERGKTGIYKNIILHDVL
jgi:inosine-uridine nucleoside N-ribohydrolase